MSIGNGFTERLAALPPLEQIDCLEDSIADLTRVLLDTLRTMPYPAYLETGHWHHVRAKALERAGHHCQLCNGDTDLDVHHRTYERRGCEKPGDLVALCNACHGQFHGMLPVAA